jgi:hypothetical protein
MVSLLMWIANSDASVQAGCSLTAYAGDISALAWCQGHEAFHTICNVTDRVLQMVQP